MARRLVVLIAGLILSCYVFSRLARCGGTDQNHLWTWVKFYRDGLRTPLFTGFLTMGTFLLTLQATILLRIKEIYDDANYAATWQVLQDQRKAKGLPQTGYYAPLRNLGLALLASIFCALTSSLAQVTLGFVNAPWAVGICLGCAATTFGLILFLWWQIAANLVRWFTEIEAKRPR